MNRMRMNETEWATVILLREVLFFQTSYTEDTENHRGLGGVFS